MAFEMKLKLDAFILSDVGYDEDVVIFFSYFKRADSETKISLILHHLILHLLNISGISHLTED